jgi:hypothetical protein
MLLLITEAELLAGLLAVQIQTFYDFVQRWKARDDLEKAEEARLKTEVEHQVHECMQLGQPVPIRPEWVDSGGGEAPARRQVSLTL